MGAAGEQFGAVGGEKASGMLGLRYALRPRVGEALHLSDDEEWPITAVHDNGQRVTATDRVGRTRLLTRAVNGTWLVATNREDQP